MKLKEDQISETMLYKTDDGWVFILGKDKIELYHLLYHFSDFKGFAFPLDKVNFNENAEAVKRILLDKLKLCEGELGEQKQENKDNK
jgi:hypothetical protein